MSKILNSELAEKTLNATLNLLGENPERFGFRPEDHSGVNIILIPDTDDQLEEHLILGKFSGELRRSATAVNAREKAERVVVQGKGPGVPMSSFFNRDVVEKKYGGGLYFSRDLTFKVGSPLGIACSGLPEVWDEIFVLALIELTFPGDTLEYYIKNIERSDKRDERFVLAQAKKIVTVVS